jgi:hypothetical protein
VSYRLIEAASSSPTFAAIMTHTGILRQQDALPGIAKCIYVLTIMKGFTLPALEHRQVPYLEQPAAAASSHNAPCSTIIARLWKPYGITNKINIMQQGAATRSRVPQAAAMLQHPQRSKTGLAPTTG